MASSRSARKKQTTLSFSPLSTSSPARASQPEAIRERAAAVVFSDGSQPAKRRKTIREYLPSPSSLRSGTRSSEQHSSPPRTTRSFMTGQVQQTENIGRVNNPALTELHSLGIFDDSESDTPGMFSSPKKRGRGHKAERSSDEENSSSEEDQVPSPSKHQASKKRTRRRTISPGTSDRQVETQSKEISENDDDDDEDALPSRPSRRHPRTPSKEQQDPVIEQAKADIDEDLDFLGEVDTETPRAVRPVSEKKSAKQQALDALRKKRMQRGTQPSDGSMNRNDGNAQVYTEDQSGDEEASDNHSSYNEDVENYDPPENGDEDFIVDDEGDEPLGTPVALPFEFSHYRVMKPKQRFKWVVEWMVQKKINPAFPIEDEIYKSSFEGLDDFVRGLGGSKFTSSAWTPAFSKALKSRPTLKSHELIDRSVLRNHCEACNRSGHPATWEVSFQGKTYNKKSLEEDSSDEESGGSSDDSSMNESTFQIGRFCMKNANMAHTLTHWRFHLKEWVIDFLRDTGEITSEKIVQRDRWTTSKRRKDAERIVDSMESEGEIRRLYRDFQNQVTEAQFANDTSGMADSSP